MIVSVNAPSIEVSFLRQFCWNSDQNSFDSPNSWLSPKGIYLRSIECSKGLHHMNFAVNIAASIRAQVWGSRGNDYPTFYALKIRISLLRKKVTDREYLKSGMENCMPNNFQGFPPIFSLQFMYFLHTVVEKKWRCVTFICVKFMHIFYA